MAIPICRRLLQQPTNCDCTRAFRNAGSNSAIRRAMIPMTTRSSTSENPPRRRFPRKAPRWTMLIIRLLPRPRCARTEHSGLRSPRPESTGSPTENWQSHGICRTDSWSVLRVRFSDPIHLNIIQQLHNIPLSSGFCNYEVSYSFDSFRAHFPIPLRGAVIVSKSASRDSLRHR